MTPELMRDLKTRLNKMSTETLNIAPYFEDLDIHPGKFGITPNDNGGYEIWIEADDKFSNLRWGVQAFVPSSKVITKAYPLELRHILPIFEVLKEVKEKTALDPSYRDNRVKYLNE